MTAGRSSTSISCMLANKTHVVIESFTCSACGDYSPHHWHLVAGKSVGPACPVIAVSICSKCDRAIVWIGGKVVWESANSVRNAGRPVLAQQDQPCAAVLVAGRRH